MMRPAKLIADRLKYFLCRNRCRHDLILVVQCKSFPTVCPNCGAASVKSVQHTSTNWNTYVVTLLFLRKQEIAHNLSNDLSTMTTLTSASLFEQIAYKGNPRRLLRLKDLKS
eukprot:738415-Amphidinium_carterae.1